MNKEEYIIKQINLEYKCNLPDFINKIKNSNRIIFTKFGDGEFNCMNYEKGHNCDGDTYTDNLGDNLKKSFLDLCNLSKNEDIYIGKWHSDENKIIRYYGDLLYNNLIENKTDLIDIPFVDYHLCYNDHLSFGENHDLYNFVKTIQDINKFKIIISNNNNIRLLNIFKGDFYITIPYNSWFANNMYNELYNILYNYLNENNDAIVILSAGLASKILISNLALKFENASFIDIGSGFDLLASKKLTRSWSKTHSYIDEYNYYKNLLPNDFL